MARWRLALPVLAIFLLSAALYRSWDAPGDTGVDHGTRFDELPVRLPVPSPTRLYPPRPPLPPPPPPPPVLYPEPAPRITIIAVWTPRGKPPTYLPHFFASAAGNPSLDILFIKVDVNHAGCHEPLAHGTPNIREVCLSVEEYWKLHADFLCGYWNCSSTDIRAVVSKLRERSSDDRVNSYFRPFRAAVFKKWVNPSTKIWGWCDLDIMLGNFERSFPWDIAEDFDILVPAAPTNGDDIILLYLPGHLAFFKHATHISDQFMNLPNLQTMDAYMTMPWIGSDAEECEYSHFAFLDSNLTFLRFNAMVYTRFHLSSPEAGTYNLENEYRWDLSPAPLPFPTTTESRKIIYSLVREHENTWTKKPIFSEAGTEYQVTLREGEWPSFFWCSKERRAIDFVTNYTLYQREFGKRYVMRRTSRGPIFDRQEPDEPILFLPATPDASETYNRHNRPYLRELLYNHFQVEKYRDWWSLPREAIRKGEFLFMDKEQGLEMWDSDGQLLFDTAANQ
ncbi:hypothetical protein BOTBODRAFT_169589 [Botryobasidium botryosum FD-172 SS1]|uniref:Glycosyltransferase family 34 protein n=1 Tax=Botryobasidium botryosum (strain FD-172 SS1) TaxID=930990 RepID=A0A067N9W0_BOTB1|nr:hypothetical protein BOTBODRAFT_169589 [Botryobasidium botryosum FD-172 SS1]